MILHFGQQLSWMLTLCLWGEYNTACKLWYTFFEQCYLPNSQTHI